MTDISPAHPGPGEPGGPVDYAAASRAALVEALLAAGPGQPTLCEGWRTEHLAAHIVLRERSALAAGLVLPPVQHALDRRTLELGDAHADDAGYAALVDKVEAGPLGTDGTGADGTGEAGDGRGRRVGALVRSALDRVRRTGPGTRVASQVQLLEFFVHAEDVRRAQDRWAPRILTDDYADTLYTHLKSRARLLYAGEDTGVRLERRARAGSTTDNTPALVRRPGRDGRILHVTGEAGELVMHAHGRRGAALVLEDVVESTHG